VSTGWHTVHVRVNDATTGQPTPVRVRFVDADGRYLPPFGHPAHCATGANEDVGGNLRLAGKEYAYIDGTCEIRLPAEPFGVEITKGPEYRPVRQEVTLGPGKLALRFTLERWTDLRREGWYSGDTRALFMAPHAALLEAAAEDVAVINLLACELPLQRTPHGGVVAVPNILAFSGQKPALQTPGHLVSVNTLNRHPKLGQLALLNCHRVVYPLTFGGEDGKEDWSLADWCDQCHRKSGLVVWSDSFPEALHGEALANLVLGKIDALDAGQVDGDSLALGTWYDLLNCGARVPLVAGSWKHSNQNLLGGRRTYARLPPESELSYGAWIEAVRAGRTFVTNGPLLSFSVNDQEPGAVVCLPAKAPSTVRIRVQAQSIVPFERLEIVHNGVVIAGAEASGSPANAILEMELALASSSWLAARCWGPPQSLASPDRPGERVAAHTAPVYVELADKPLPIDGHALAVFVEYLDETLAWLAANGRFDTDKQRQHLTGILEAARAELVRRGERRA
jgi:hypothetical protein